MNNLQWKLTQALQEFSGKLCTFPLKSYVPKKNFTGWGFLEVIIPKQIFNRLKPLKDSLKIPKSEVFPSQKLPTGIIFSSLLFPLDFSSFWCFHLVEFYWHFYIQPFLSPPPEDEALQHPMGCCFCGELCPGVKDK